MKRLLPPFGKRLKDKIKSGWQPSNGINVCTFWNIRSVLHAVTFPSDAAPDDFDWTFLSGQEISLINTDTASNCDYEKLKELAILLVESGAKNVGLVDPNHPLQWFVPEVKGVAA